jgi:predicted ferric reductase
VSPIQRQRRRSKVDDLKESLERLSLPHFMVITRRMKYAKAWLLGMRKYFQLHNYSSNVEAIIETYHLQGKTSMWWDQLKKVKHRSKDNFLEEIQEIFPTTILVREVL